jgi:hypothetical protein
VKFTGPANVILDHIAADFPALQVSFGHVCERVGRNFDASNGRVEYEFADDDGSVWHGPDGQYEMYPYDDEDDEAFCPPNPQAVEPIR